MDKTFNNMISIYNISDWKIATDYLIDKGASEEVINKHISLTNFLGQFNPIRDKIIQCHDLIRGTSINESVKINELDLVLSIKSRKPRNEHYRLTDHWSLWTIKDLRFHHHGIYVFFANKLHRNKLERYNYLQTLEKLYNRFSNYNFCTDDLKEFPHSMCSNQLNFNLFIIEEIRRLDNRIKFS